MRVTCILTSHAKPAYVHEAIDSVRRQRDCRWQLIVMDSGPLLHAGEFRRYAQDRRITLAATGETDALRASVCIQGWAINECFRRGLVGGDLVCYLPDDDIYFPWAFRTFAAAARRRPGQAAWAGAALCTEALPDGERLRGLLLADDITPGQSLDCIIDGMQVCHRAEVRVPWPEERDVAAHADGVFLARLGDHTPIHPLPALIGRHRHTPLSTFTRPPTDGTGEATHAT